MQICETNRLIIRQLDISDTAFIYELTNSPGWLQFIGDRGIHNLHDAEAYIVNGPMESYKKYGHGLYLLALKESNTPIGMCGLLQRDYLEYKDIGFALLPAYNGHGYAQEAAAAILQQGRLLHNIDTVAAITLAGNTRSIQLLTRLGMVYDKMIRIPPNQEELMLFVTPHSA